MKVVPETLLGRCNIHRNPTFWVFETGARAEDPRLRVIRARRRQSPLNASVTGTFAPDPHPKRSIPVVIANIVQPTVAECRYLLCFSGKHRAGDELRSRPPSNFNRLGECRHTYPQNLEWPIIIYFENRSELASPFASYHVPFPKKVRETITWSGALWGLASAQCAVHRSGSPPGAPTSVMGGSCASQIEPVSDMGIAPRRYPRAYDMPWRDSSMLDTRQSKIWSAGLAASRSVGELECGRQVSSFKLVVVDVRWISIPGCQGWKAGYHGLEHERGTTEGEKARKWQSDCYDPLILSTEQVHM
ncbi:hypothetical protein FPV67DRAFT_1652520, partial [Lyophyllum atratum]